MALGGDNAMPTFTESQALDAPDAAADEPGAGADAPVAADEVEPLEEHALSASALAAAATAQAPPSRDFGGRSLMFCPFFAGAFLGPAGTSA